VEVMAEELGVLLGLSLHDRAVHGEVLVDEDRLLVVVTVEGSLATVAPVTVAVSAAGSGVATDAAVLALEATSEVRIGNAAEGGSAVNTGEDVAVDAIVVASPVGGNVSLAAIGGETVAVGEASVADEDAVTTGLEVGGIAVAVGEEGSGVNLAGDVLAVEVGVGVLEGLRAAVGESAARVSGGRLADRAPLVGILATVARVVVAVLVVEETTVAALEASRLEAASTAVKTVGDTTEAADEAELGEVDVVTLGTERLLRPDRAIPRADGSGVARSGVGDGSLATVLPVVIGIAAELSIAGKRALVVDASRLGDGGVGGERIGAPSEGTGEVTKGVRRRADDARARLVTDLGLATVVGVTVAVLEAGEARELASTKVVEVTVLATTAVNGGGGVDVLLTEHVQAVVGNPLRGGLRAIVELTGSVAEGSLATVGGRTSKPVPANEAVGIDASRDLDLATVTRIAVAVVVAVLALVVAGTLTVTTTDAVEDEVVDREAKGVETIVGDLRGSEVVVGPEELLEASIVEGVDARGLVDGRARTVRATKAGNNVAPSTTTVPDGARIIGGVVDFLEVATEGSDDLADVERGESVVVGGTRSVALRDVRTHQAAVEGLAVGVAVVEVVALGNLATVLPAVVEGLVSVIARLEAAGGSNASVEVASETLGGLRGIADATKAERRCVAVGEITEIDGRDKAEVGNVSLSVDVTVGPAVLGDEVEGTVGVGTLGTVVDTIAVGVDGVVDTRHVVAVTASTSKTASGVLREVLATVARITVAIEVTGSGVAGVDATTSGGRGNVGVALNGHAASELARVGSSELRAVEGSNESMVVLAVGNVGAIELVIENVVGVEESVLLKSEG